MDLRREINYRLYIRRENALYRLKEEEIFPNFTIKEFESMVKGFPEALYEVCKKNKASLKEMFDKTLHILMKHYPIRLFSIENYFGRHYLKEKLTEMNVYARKESNNKAVVLNCETVSMIISYLDTSDLLNLVKAFF